MKYWMLLPLPAMLALGACGGGGGGVGSTPTPAPSPTPTPANTFITDLKVSQSFANDAGSISMSVNGSTGKAVDAARESGSLTVSYDAASRSYTIKVGDYDRTFSPADIDGSNSNAAGTLYNKGNGESLQLVTQLGMASKSNQYVALGYLRRSTVTATGGIVRASIFPYGLETPASAVPRTGIAVFAIDAFGVSAPVGFEPSIYNGSGTFSADFASNVFSATASLTDRSGTAQTTGGLIEIQASGLLSSAQGSFSGYVRVGLRDSESTGAIDGRFYGPGAEELGAAFTAAGKNGALVAGGFTGQRSVTAQPVNLTLQNLTQRQQFWTRMSGLTGALEWQAPDTFAANAGSSDFNNGTFSPADKIVDADPNFTAYRKTLTNSSNGPQDVTVRFYKPGPANSELALSYASFGHWATRVGFGGGTVPGHRIFTYGLETTPRLLTARTGTASYNGIVYGLNFKAGDYWTVKGTSQFDVDFSAQTYSGLLSMTATSPTGTSANLGSYNFAASIVSYAGGIETTLTRAGQAVGTMNARFYGPMGEEIAAPFYLNVPVGTEGGGTSVAGVALAKH